MTALSLDPQPPKADQRALFPIAGAEGLKYRSQALVGKIGDEVISRVDDLRRFVVGLHGADRSR